MAPVPDIAAVLARHRFGVLHFSGGKDSLACLWLLEPHWKKVVVAWCDTGDAFPETIALMRWVRDMVPHFMVVQSNVRAQNDAWGWPVDVLPVRNHRAVIEIMHPHERPRLQSCFACCRDNIWKPMHEAMTRMGATLIIRGQRVDEVQHSPVRSGDVRNGIEFLFPVEGWTSLQVREYVSSKPLGLPSNYAHMDTDLACMHCTGHLFENLGKRRYMRERHQQQHAEVSRRLSVIKEQIAADLTHLEQAAAL